jgi:SAM-dependent methyltransferase
METLEYQRMARVEEAHWWYQGMARLTCSLLDRYRPSVDSVRLLDAGCGTGGALATYLRSYGAGFGCDLSAIALSIESDRPPNTKARASVTRLPFPDASFDIVTSFDVIYERAVASDRSALLEMSRVLRQRGILLLRAPAHNWLRGQHDRATHTARRYTAGSIRSLLAESGLTPVHLTYANMCLFPAVAAKRLFERVVPPRSDTSDLDWEAGPLNGPLQRLLEAESRWAVAGSLPMGLSVVAVGRKESTP